MRRGAYRARAPVRGQKTLVAVLRSMGLLDATCVLATDPLDKISGGVLTPSVGPAMAITGAFPVVASPIPGVPAWLMDGSSWASQITGTMDVGDTEDAALILLIRSSASPFAAAAGVMLSTKTPAGRGIFVYSRWDLNIPVLFQVQGDATISGSSGLTVAPETVYFLATRVCRGTGKATVTANSTTGAAVTLPSGTLDGNQAAHLGAFPLGGNPAVDGTQILGAAVFYGAGICTTKWTTAQLEALRQRVMP